MADKPSINTIMRWIGHYAEDVATLQKYESVRYRDDKDAARFRASYRRSADRRYEEIRVALGGLVAGDPGLQVRIADTLQRELDDSAGADHRFLGEHMAAALCAEVPEIGRAVSYPAPACRDEADVLQPVG